MINKKILYMIKNSIFIEDYYVDGRGDSKEEYIIDKYLVYQTLWQHGPQISYEKFSENKNLFHKSMKKHFLPSGYFVKSDDDYYKLTKQGERIKKAHDALMKL